MDLILGIDPGAYGAVVALDRATGDLAFAWPIPTVKVPMGRCKRTRLDHLAWLAGPSGAWPDLSGALVWVEDFGPSPQDGKVSWGASGLNHGALRMWLDMRCAQDGLRWEPIAAQAWKKVLRIPPGSDKTVSVERARRLWPTLLEGHAKATREGLADAALIAEACRRAVFGSVDRPD